MQHTVVPSRAEHICLREQDCLTLIAVKEFSLPGILGVRLFWCACTKKSRLAKKIKPHMHRNTTLRSDFRTLDSRYSADSHVKPPCLCFRLSGASLKQRIEIPFLRPRHIISHRTYDPYNYPNAPRVTLQKPTSNLASKSLNPKTLNLKTP